MKIEKIADNKIKVVFSQKEYSPSSNNELLFSDSEFKKFFVSILNNAEREHSFKINDEKILIEIIFEKNDTYIFFVTKYPTKDINNKHSNIYCFKSLDDFYDFINYYSKNIEKASLYEYKNLYYLIVENIKEDLDYTICEFCDSVKSSISFESKLKEHGKFILNQVLF